MFRKEIVWFADRCVLACDGRCDKAWGINNRPRHVPPDACDDDDFAFLADDELGTAPEHPGTWEGGDGKDPRSLNKWCARECERSRIFEDDEVITPSALPLFATRLWNLPHRTELTTE